VNHWLLFTATELEQPLWRIARHTHQYPIEKRLAAEIPIARQDFLDMAAVMEKHLETRPVLVGENVTVADFVAAYTLDMASVVHLLEALPNLRAYMERMYARPKAPQRIAQAFASLRG
jgi:glutathione S-transferase